MIVALITARGGSKGLPRKNVLPLDGKPLICWTINAALDSSYIDRVYVSTEDDEIKKVSEDNNALCIDRPIELATDLSSSEEVVLHAIEYFKASNVSVDTIILLQPTSPLRTVKHINEAIDVFRNKNANFVLSVFEPSHTPVKAYLLDECGELKGLYNATAPYMRRQDLPIAFQPNGAIYIFGCNAFIKSKSFPQTKVFPYVMNEQESIDVDTLSDLLKIESLIKE